MPKQAKKYRTWSDCLVEPTNGLMAEVGKLAALNNDSRLENSIAFNIEDYERTLAQALVHLCTLSNELGLDFSIAARNIMLEKLKNKQEMSVTT